MLGTRSQTCLGTIGMSRASIVACGVLVRITTVRASGVVTEAKVATKFPLAVRASASRSIRS